LDGRYAGVELMKTVAGTLKSDIRKRVQGRDEQDDYPKGTAAEIRLKSSESERPSRRPRRGGGRKKKKKRQAQLSWNLYVEGELARADLTETEAYSYLEPSRESVGQS